MMWRHAESLMAGAGAFYLYFYTESMQNIIQSLIGRYENGLHRYTHRVQWGPVHNVYMRDYDSPVYKIALYMLQGNNRISM